MNKTPIFTIVNTPRKKKAKNDVIRASYQYIIKPIKFINPFRNYLLPGDIMVTENNGVISTKFSSICQYKLIRGFEFEENSQIFRFFFYENKVYDSSFPWKYLVNRLMSFGTIESKEWADSIERYCEIIDYITENFEKIHNSLSQENEDLIKLQEFLYEKTYDVNTPNSIPQVFVIKKISKENISITEVDFNVQFAKILGYDLTFLKSLAFKNTIPEIISKINQGKNLKKLLNKPDSDEKYTIHLLTKNGALKQMSFKSVVDTAGISNASYIIRKHIMVIDPESIKDSNIKTYEEPYPDFELK